MDILFLLEIFFLLKMKIYYWFGLNILLFISPSFFQQRDSHYDPFVLLPPFYQR